MPATSVRRHYSLMSEKLPILLPEPRLYFPAIVLPPSFVNVTEAFSPSVGFPLSVSFSASVPLTSPSNVAIESGPHSSCNVTFPSFDVDHGYPEPLDFIFVALAIGIR